MPLAYGVVLRHGALWFEQNIVSAPAAETSILLSDAISRRCADVPDDRKTECAKALLALARELERLSHDLAG